MVILAGIRNPVLILFFSSALALPAAAQDIYIYGGPKMSQSSVTQQGLDKAVIDLAHPDFSAARVEADPAGFGFDIGIGVSVTNEFDVEGGFVYMGEFEIIMKTARPSKPLAATSSAWSIPIVGKFKVGDSHANFFVKAGGHYWNQSSEIASPKGKVVVEGTGLDPVVGIGAELFYCVVAYDYYRFSDDAARVGIGNGGMSTLSITWKADLMALMDML